MGIGFKDVDKESATEWAEEINILREVIDDIDDHYEWDDLQKVIIRLAIENRIDKGYKELEQLGVDELQTETLLRTIANERNIERVNKRVERRISWINALIFSLIFMSIIIALAR